MYNNVLTDLLKTFSEKEIKEFREFLKSPFFNKRQGVINLYEIIIKFHPEYADEFFSKDKIFSKLFPGKKYNDSTLRVLSHYLIDLAEKYIAYKKFEKDNLEFSVQLESELRYRKQYKLLEKNIGRAFKNLEDSEVDAETYFFYKFRLESEKTYYLLDSNYAQFEKFIDKSDWGNVFKDLTNFYVFKSLIIYHHILVLSTLFNKDFKSETFEEMFKKIKAEDYEDVPVIKIYYYIIKMTVDINDESHFYKVKELLQKNKALMNHYDIIGTYVNLNNYCSKKIIEGKTKFEKERFDIYREEIIEKTYLMNDGFMSPIFYKNVVTSGLSLKEYPWVKNFIYKYKNELNKKYRDNYFSHCLSLYEFNTGNYDSAMELNSRIKYDELYMKLNSKILQMQLLYETGADETLLSSLETFRHFLNNNKLIPATSKNSFTNFHKYLNKIFLFKNKKDKSEAGLIRKNLSNENSIVGKSWLLNKIDELS
jgi:hypothetical protein